MDKIQVLKTQYGLSKWTQGYVCAVCVLIQLNDEVDTRTRELFQAGVGGMSLNSLQEMGIYAFDLQLLKKWWKELHRD